MIKYIAEKLSGLFPTTTPQPPQAQENFQASTGDNFGTLANTLYSGGKSERGLSTYQKTLILDHTALRQNTRYAVHDSLQARTILKRSNDSVIANGLKLDPTPDWKILGITREKAEEWAEDIKNRFHIWAKTKHGDLTGRNTFYQNTRFYGWQRERDGEVFVRITYSENPALLNPLQISFIDPNQIRGDEWTFSTGPEEQDTGIITDKNGKEIGYKVWINEGGVQKPITIDAIDEKTGRQIMIHGFDPEYAGQERGISELSNGLQNYEDITSFSTATIKKAINGASLGFTVENKQQDPSDMGFTQLDNGSAGPPVTTTPGTTTTAPTAIGVDGVSVRQLPEATIKEPGTINVFGGAAGDELKAIPSNTPAESTGDYVDHEFSYLSAAVSMPLSIAKMKFDKSHSASRGELGLYADVKEIKKDDIAADFLDIIYKIWLAEEIAAGRVKALGFSDPLLRAAWCSCNWIGKPLPDVDPLKTMQAKKAATELGYTDLDREAMLYNGSSGKTNRAKLARQLDELSTDPFGIREQEITEPEQEPDEEEEE